MRSSQAHVLTICSIRRATQGLEPPWLNIGQEPATYNRENKARYPYKSHWQYVRAWYGMIACGAMAFFNGWRSIHPISGKDFIASYISVSHWSPVLSDFTKTASQIFIFLLISAAYHVKIDKTWNPLGWSISASEDLSNPERASQTNATYRRGKLHRRDPDHTASWQNIRGFCEWIWVWMK